MTRTSSPAPLPAGEGCPQSLRERCPQTLRDERPRALRDERLRGRDHRVHFPFPLSAKRTGHVCPCSSGVRFGERGPGGVGHRHA